MAKRKKQMVATSCNFGMLTTISPNGRKKSRCLTFAEAAKLRKRRRK